jgi:hypothetical protein
MANVWQTKPLVAKTKGLTMHLNFGTNDPYKEEALAECADYVIWVHGRVDELIQRGVLKKAESDITDKGRALYRELIAQGFEPERHKLITTLKNTPECPSNKVEIIADVLLDCTK